MRTMVWFRGKDLRITDHLPLLDAIAEGEVITLFLMDPFFFAPEKALELPHRMQFLLSSLSALQRNIEKRGGELLLVRGRAVDVIPRLVARWGVQKMVAHRWSEPMGRLRDALIRDRLSIPFSLYEGETILPPETVRTRANTPFSVFTPFSRAAREALGDHRPAPAPRAIPAPPGDLDRSELIPTVPAPQELGITENPRILPGGESAGRARFTHFVQRLDDYDVARDQLGAEGTSRLSADLKFGTISAREVFFRISAAAPSASRERYLNQLLWREFAYHCLWDRPELLVEPFRSDFRDFPWSTDHAAWACWAEGRTGYPIVDASARQLLLEGYVHNRARMISASFLTKHLLVDYRLGERHYLKYLTDGDWALNNMGWQWSAGCGVDAQPYFRVFNPITQGQKFDAKGSYVRRYLPELARLPNKFIHRPFEAPTEVLAEAGVELGRTYPLPVVDHSFARNRFLSEASRYLRQ